MQQTYTIHVCCCFRSFCSHPTTFRWIVRGAQGQVWKSSRTFHCCLVNTKQFGILQTTRNTPRLRVMTPGHAKI